MRRLVVVLVAVAVAAGGAAALVLFFTARDEARVAQADGPGERVRDLCASHEDEPREPTSRPPTSGPHRPELITRDAREIGDDALLHALELGNVVLAYPDARPPRRLRDLQEELSGPFDAEVAAAGQAVVLARRPDAPGPVALAWAHRETGGPEAIRTFAEYWLGRGYAAARGPGCPG